MSVGTTAVVADAHRGLILSAMSLAGVAAIDELCGVEVGVKWPNDLVWSPDASGGGGGGDSGPLKVAGILAEAVALPGQRTGYVVGIGVNCNWGEMPGPLAGTATSLDILSGEPVDRSDLAVSLIEGFARRMGLLEGDKGDVLLAEARARSATIGGEVVAQLPGGELRGLAIDLDHDGALLIATGGAGSDSVTERVTVGDVVHLRPST